MRIVLDTSALMSLAAGDVLDLAIESMDCIVPERVRAEIQGLSKNNDFEGNLAKRILDLFGNGIEILTSYKTSIEGEIECAYLANELDDVEFLITDDTLALESLEKTCRKSIRFSPMILYALCLKNKLTKKQALQSLEQ
ncbi:MAG TPA: hypothetical protein VJH22_06000 [Candidatus Nanoarchaeia archaeon]|nr:hypothetical protein [Candidatus Nanoarchaeia archaeon]